LCSAKNRENESEALAQDDGKGKLEEVEFKWRLKVDTGYRQNMTLLAIAAVCRAAVDVDQKACCRWARSNQSILPAGWAHSSKPAACCCSCQPTGQTAGQTPDICIDPAPHSMRQ